MKMPLDYPRINQFPEWFTVVAKGGYVLSGLGDSALRVVQGHELIRGVDVKLAAGKPKRILVTPGKSVHE